MKSRNRMLTVLAGSRGRLSRRGFAPSSREASAKPPLSSTTRLKPPRTRTWPSKGNTGRRETRGGLTDASRPGGRSRGKPSLPAQRRPARRGLNAAACVSPRRTTRRKVTLGRKALRPDRERQADAHLVRTAVLERIEQESDPGTNACRRGRWFDGGDPPISRRTPTRFDQQLMAGTTTVDKFNDLTLHLEFRLSWMPAALGQSPNSGVYVHDCYEVQVLDCSV